MLTNLKTRIANTKDKLFGRVEKLRAEHQAKADPRPYVPAWMERARNRYLRAVACAATGGPKLTGARLARVTKSCSVFHLTALCRGRERSSCEIT